MEENLLLMNITESYLHICKYSRYKSKSVTNLQKLSFYENLLNFFKLKNIPKQIGPDPDMSSKLIEHPVPE
jgi:hypothetical protein